MKNFKNQLNEMNEKINEQFIGLNLNGIGSNARRINLAAEQYATTSKSKLYTSFIEQKRKSHAANTRPFLTSSSAQKSESKFEKVQLS